MAVGIFTLIVVGVSLGFGLYFMTQSTTSSRTSLPNREMNTAIRLLDAVEAHDELIPTLPEDLRRDVKQFLLTYHRKHG